MIYLRWSSKKPPHQRCYLIHIETYSRREKKKKKKVFLKKKKKKKVLGVGVRKVIKVSKWGIA
jgi:hypothetical protein